MINASPHNYLATSIITIHKTKKLGGGKRIPIGMEQRGKANILLRVPRK